MVSVSTITLFGDNTAGETYSLVCSVAAIPTPTITWLDDGVEITTDSSRTVSVTTSDGSNRYSSTLTFNPLSASHAGTYTCRATLTSGEMDTDTVMITVRGECRIDTFCVASLSQCHAKTIVPVIV